VSQKSRIAPLSEAEALRRRPEKGAWRAAQAMMKNVAGIGLLVGAAFTLPQFLDAGALQNRLVAALQALAAAGEWAWMLVTVAFRSIPVW